MPGKRGCLRAALSLIAGLFLLSMIMTFLASNGPERIGDKVVENLVPTPPTLDLTFTCPAPGSGYTGTFEFDPGRQNAVTYDVIVSFAGDEVYNEPTSAELRHMKGLWPGATLDVVLQGAQSGATELIRQFKVPAEPC